MGLIRVVDALAVLLALSVLALGLLVVRRRFVSRGAATFDCSLRLPVGLDSASWHGWTLGIARYAGDTLEWYRVFSYATRPRRVLARRDLRVVERREPRGAELSVLLSGAVVVRCAGAAGPVELAMGRDTLTGFLSWLESAPPGVPSV